MSVASYNVEFYDTYWIIIPKYVEGCCHVVIRSIVYQHLTGGTEQFRDISQSGCPLSELGIETEASQIRRSSVTVFLVP
jgi:hypothetical protein